MIEISPDEDTLSGVLFEKRQFRVRKLEIKPGESVPWHFHSECIDVIVPLIGTAVLQTQTSTRSLKAKAFYILDSQEKHRINNSGKESFFYLLFQSGAYDFVKCDE